MNLSSPIRFFQIPALTGARETPIISRLGISRLESYVQFALPQLTTIILLAHMVFGCCTHHLHACETDCCSEPTANADDCRCETHLHDEHSTNFENGITRSSQGGDHHEQHQCAGGDCTFVFGQPVADEVEEIATNVCLMDVVVTDDNLDSFYSNLDRGANQRFSIAGSSLRTHLALRVLLI